ncbi:MAG TPA: ATP-binding cassette domain-containing protein [Candidatus Acetothermia bacterium]|nr:ATP-binding cassette domain-containing protein [Candidatus Acetothermia bacterium]
MSVIIQLSELSFVTEDGIKVLEDVHLRVNRGDLVFVLGPAAAGKSVLLGLLGTQIEPQEGQILVYGRNIARLSRRKAFDLRRQIGLLPQDFTPLAKTVMENVTFKLRCLGDFREQAEEKALAALDEVGLTSKLAHLATELDAIDRVRLGIALSICDEPLLLLLDDPFVGLSPEDQHEIYSLLLLLNRRGFTIVATTRDSISSAGSPARIVELVDGRVEEKS